MKLEIIGRLHEVQEPVTFGSGFTKQVIVIETDSKYDNYIAVELVKEQVGKMDGIAVGTRVRLDAYVGGREWNGKYFVSVKFAALTGVQRDLQQEPAAEQPSEPQEGPEYLPRVEMSQRAGLSLRTLDYYKEQGLLTFWYVKGKNRILFDVAKTLDQINNMAAPAQVHTAAAEPAPQKAVASTAKQTHMEVDHGDELPF